MRLATNRKFVIFLAILPILWIIVNIIVWGINLPFWDQWAFVPLLANYEDGHMIWTDLIAQHNEHRPLFPRLLWLGLAQITNYNVNAELWMNLVLAGMTSFVFGVYTHRLWNRAGLENSLQWAYLPLFSLLIFNMVQWESWLLGFQTVMFLGIGCTVAGLLVITNHPDWSGLIASAVLGVIATYSMANALLFWPLGLFLIVISHHHQRLWKSLTWLVIAIAISMSFLYNWSSPHTNLANISSINPTDYIHWVLNFLGAPLLAYPPAFLFGALGLGMLGLLTIKMWSRSPARILSPYYAIMMFILGSGLVIGIGRSYGGARLALAPRYITQTSWYWASLLAILPLAKINYMLRNVFLALIAALLLLSSTGGAVSAYKWRYLRVLPVYKAVLAGESPTDEALSAIYGDVEPGVTRSRLEIVCSHDWSACPTDN